MLLELVIEDASAQLHHVKNGLVVSWPFHGHCPSVDMHLQCCDEFSVFTVDVYAYAMAVIELIDCLLADDCSETVNVEIGNDPFKQGDKELRV